MISINLQVTSLLRSNNIIYINFCHSTMLLIISTVMLTIDTFLAFFGWFLYRREKKKGSLNVKILEPQRLVLFLN
uniref:7TM_GPCR_Srx domain-containing protein n=1 Tax=Parastrongyloides trichosuri TaxID=131310 RepID=A0A0N4ZNI4_PARTI